MIDVQFDPAAFRMLQQRLPDPVSVQRGLDRRWARDAELRAKEKYSGGPGSHTITSRTGNSRGRISASVTPTGARLRISGPGVGSLEEGAVIVPKRGTPIKNRKGQVLRYAPYLRFRLHLPQDTAQATGRWVMARQVTIRARHPIRDSALEALHDLPFMLAEVLRTGP